MALTLTETDDVPHGCQPSLHIGITEELKKKKRSMLFFFLHLGLKPLGSHTVREGVDGAGEL